MLVWSVTRWCPALSAAGHKSGIGGGLILARDDVNSIVEICKYETAERMSCTVHTDLGPSIVNWHRPPDDYVFRIELVQLLWKIMLVQSSWAI